MTKLHLTPDHAWTIQKWPDPAAETEGVEVTLTPDEPADHYFANFWLPILGPTCTILAARLAGATYEESRVPVTAGYLAASLGLSQPHGRNCALSNSLDRLEKFKVIRRVGVQGADDTIQARTHIRVLTGGQHERLPEELKPVHLAWLRIVHQRHLDRLDPNCDPKSPFLRKAAV